MSVKELGRTQGVLASSGEHGAVSVEIGDVLVGKYKVESILGQGGMGVVVAALHLQLQERVALKFLRPGAARSDEFNARFLREAQVTAKLRNEHIVKVTDVGMLESGAPYMVMEYVSGTDMRRLMRSEGPMPVDRAINYVIQACEGLAEAHALGVVHRDLKPSNLFVTHRRDGSELVKVLDFGISKANLLLAEELEDLTAAGAMLGSPKYMSPEQLTSTADVDERSDVWSLAVVLYEMLVGAPPFVADTHAATCVKVLGNDPPASILARRQDVPPALEQAILHALERDMAQRTKNIAWFAEEIVDATREYVPASIAVSVDRIRGTIDSRSKGTKSSPPTSRADNSSRAVLSQTFGSTSQHRSGSGAVMSTRTEPQHKTGLWIAGGLVLATVLVIVAFVVLRRPEQPTTSGLAAGPSTPATVVDSTPSGSPDATPASTQVATAPPTGTAEAPPETSATGDTTGKKPGGRYVPPPRTTTPPATTPATTPTGPATTPKKVDPLEERQ